MNMTQAIDLLKDRFTAAVPAGLILRLCHDVGHCWRERDLGPVVTTHLFLQQVLHGNTACSDLRLLNGLSFSDSAYCRARARLPRALLERLQAAVVAPWRSDADADPATRWRGHRVYLVDGSSFSMPDTPALQQQFGQPGGQAKGCGFPVAHLMVLFDAATGYLLQTEALPLRTHDMARAAVLHQSLRLADVLVGDRAFGSFAHLALCRQRGIHGLFRAHQRQIVNFLPHRPHRHSSKRTRGQTGMPTSRWLKRLGKHDQLVEYFQPKECPVWLTAEEYAQLPKSLVVREVRYRIRGLPRRSRVVTLVTTLLDPECYPASALARLYGLRWQVEIFHADYRSSNSLYLGGFAA
jgi:hypothetical protein